MIDYNIGDRIRLVRLRSNTNLKSAIGKYVGKSGVIVGKDSGELRIKFDCQEDKANWYIFMDEIELIYDIQTPTGYNRCRCGAITTNNVCCDCK